jgi:hypothetical protein
MNQSHFFCYGNLFRGTGNDESKPRPAQMNETFSYRSDQTRTSTGKSLGDSTKSGKVLQDSKYTGKMSGVYLDWTPTDPLKIRQSKNLLGHSGHRVGYFGRFPESRFDYEKDVLIQLASFDENQNKLKILLKKKRSAENGKNAAVRGIRYNNLILYVETKFLRSEKTLSILSSLNPEGFKMIKASYDLAKSLEEKVEEDHHYF